MYHSTTSTNLITAKISSSGISRAREISAYQMPTSIAVTTARTTAMRTYSFGLGWRTVRPRAGVGEAGSRTSARSTRCLLSRRDQVHDREDHDPHDVDEVPVQADELHGHRVAGRDPPGERH